jgi:transposase-like protein
MKERRKFNLEFKFEAVKMVKDRGVALNQVISQAYLGR